MDTPIARPLNILVVEDHDDLREVMVQALVSRGHNVRGIDCGEALDEEMGRFSPEVLLLDLNLPGEDGLSLARRLRAAQPAIGIIMVTARDQAQDVMRGYRSGADIYVSKPVTPDELDAAIHALVRRLYPSVRDEHRLTLNQRTMLLNGPNGHVDVSAQDSLILSALARACSHRLETWQLLEVLDKPADELETRALAVHIVRLRKKLEQVGTTGPTIKAIRGVGYQLCVELELGGN